MVWTDLGSFHFSYAVYSYFLRGSRLWRLSSRLSEIKRSVRIVGMPAFHFGLEELLLAGGFTPQTHEPNQD